MTVHPRLCVSGISSWSWSLAEDVALYRRTGVHTIGVSLRKLDAEGVDHGVDLLREAGLHVANVIGLGPFALDQPAQWPAQRERVLAAVDVAVRLGAGCLVLTTGPAGALRWDAAAEALATALAPVLTDARRAGVTIALEHTNPFRVDVGFVHTLRDAIDLAGALDVAVCMEVNACWAERGLEATIAAHVDRLAIVQVSDFRVGTMCTPDRAVPGDGDIPFAAILGALLAAGYAGPFDLELIGPRIEAEGYERAIGRGLDWLGALLDELGGP